MYAAAVQTLMSLSSSGPVRWEYTLGGFCRAAASAACMLPRICIAFPIASASTAVHKKRLTWSSQPKLGPGSLIWLLLDSKAQHFNSALPHLSDTLDSKMPVCSLCGKFFEGTYDEVRSHDDNCPGSALPQVPHPSKLPPPLKPCPHPACKPSSNETKHCPCPLISASFDKENKEKVWHICSWDLVNLNLGR